MIVPFQLTDADIRTDVLLLGDLTAVLRVEIIAPDGTSLTAGAGADETLGDAFRVLRVVPADVLPAPARAAGQWQAVLTVDERDLKNRLARLRKQLSQIEGGDQVFKRTLGAVDTHGVPFTLSVQARSALRMTAALSQQSRLPGHPGRLEVTLTDSGVPLSGRAAVHAGVTSPTGITSTVTLAEAEPGLYRGEIPTSVSGVYRILVSAAGADLRGTRFTREELRTLAVWARGDDSPPVVTHPGTGAGTSGIDVCGLLLCLLRDDNIRDLLKRHEVDPDVITRCVKRACG